MTFMPASLRLPLAALLLAFALAGCQTDSTGKPAAQAAPLAPVDHQQASLDCWMATEHGHADLPLDKRADVVDACIKAKMAGQPWPPAHAGKPKPGAKKPSKTKAKKSKAKKPKAKKPKTPPKS
jgi:hypothetical protein